MQPPHPIRRFVPHRTGEATPLGHLETAVMEAVWGQSTPVSVGEVHAALPPEMSVAYNTIKTTMERLESKGILSRQKAGKAYLYRAVVTQDELERRIVGSALDRLVEQFPNAVASFFVRPDATLSDDKLALLQDAVRRSREGDDA